MGRRLFNSHPEAVLDDDDDENFFRVAEPVGLRSRRPNWVQSSPSRHHSIAAAAANAINKAPEPRQQHDRDLERLAEAFPTLGWRQISNVLRSSSNVAEAAYCLAVLSDGLSRLQEDDNRYNSSAAGTHGGVDLWAALPVECQRQVLAHLSLREAATAASTCRSLAANLRSLTLPLKILSLPPGISCSAIRGMVAGFPNARTVSAINLIRALPRSVESAAMSDARGIGAVIDALTIGALERRSGVPIDHVDLSRCDSVSDSDIKQLCQRLPRTRRITLDSCRSVTDAALAHISRHAHPSSRRDNEHAAAVSVAELEISSDSATSGIQELSIANCSSITPDGARSLLHGATTAISLTYLNISGLELSGHPNLTLNPKGKLQQLVARECRCFRTVSWQLPPCHPLQRVDLSGCRDLGNACVTAQSLTELKLSRSMMWTLDLKCPNLRKLEVYIEHVQLSCPNLQEACFANCRLLPYFSFAEHDTGGLATSPLTQLRRLDLSGCECITALTLDHEEALERLDVSRCTALTELVVTSPHLRCLRARECMQLKSLTLHTETMCELSLPGCTALENVSMPCTIATAADNNGALQVTIIGTLNIDNCHALSWRMRRRLVVSAVDVAWS